MIIKVEVIGPNPACARCKKTEENARKAAEKLKAEGHDIEVTKVDVMSGVLKLQGKLPDPGVVERLIRDAI